MDWDPTQLEYYERIVRDIVAAPRVVFGVASSLDATAVASCDGGRGEYRVATNYNHFTERDTVDTLVLPWLTTQHGFPKAESLDYQAQHTVETQDGSGRYDGLYLAGGFPYAVLEAKRYSHDLTDDDAAQARGYATC